MILQTHMYLTVPQTCLSVLFKKTNIFIKVRFWFKFFYYVIYLFVGPPTFTSFLYYNVLRCSISTYKLFMSSQNVLDLLSKSDNPKESDALKRTILGTSMQLAIVFPQHATSCPQSYLTIPLLGEILFAFNWWLNFHGTLVSKQVFPKVVDP